jgi:hypothetical protein
VSIRCCLETSILVCADVLEFSSSLLKVYFTWFPIIAMKYMFVTIESHLQVLLNIIMAKTPMNWQDVSFHVSSIEVAIAMANHYN